MKRFDKLLRFAHGPRCRHNSHCRHELASRSSTHLSIKCQHFSMHSVIWICAERDTSISDCSYTPCPHTSSQINNPRSRPIAEDMDANTLWTIVFGLAATMIGLVTIWQNFRLIDDRAQGTHKVHFRLEPGLTLASRSLRQERRETVVWNAEQSTLMRVRVIRWRLARCLPLMIFARGKGENIGMVTRSELLMLTGARSSRLPGVTGKRPIVTYP